MGTGFTGPLSFLAGRKAKRSTANAVGPPTTANRDHIEAGRNFTAVGVAVRNLLRRKTTSRWQLSCRYSSHGHRPPEVSDMKQKFAWIGLAFLFVVAPLAFSQDGTPQPCPDVESGALGCEPVAWSRLQEPMPLPGARRKTRATRGSASWSIIEFPGSATNTQAEHYRHRRETRRKVRSEGGRQHDLPTR